MVKIVVIDSGLDSMYKNINLKKGIAVIEGNGGLQISDDITDFVGHGTSTVDIIFQNNPNVEIIPIKICDDTIHTSLDKLCFALSYVSKYVDFDIIQASMGIITYSSELHKLVRHIVNDMHKIIISAFDNAGAISYPAAFDEVIGIDINSEYKNKEDYDISLNSTIDILGAEIYYRTAFLKGKKTVTHGTSMLTSYFSAIIATFYTERITKKQILDYLSGNARHTYEESGEFFHPSAFVKSIKKAIVFPFNKEIHSVAAFEDLVPFKIINYYDIKHKFLLGRRICDILGYSTNEKIINNIENLDWNEDFDTIILGHLWEISNMLNRNMLDELLACCKEHNKRAFCFDNLFEIFSNYENSDELFCPYEINQASYSYLFGKMNIPHIPVLGIYGTSSRQGKYTVQLSIHREFKKRSVKVACLGTEPSGPIIGYNECVPCGYGSYRYIDQTEFVKYCNALIWKLEKTNPEIIITGGQSGTITNSLYHERYLNLTQYSLLLGTNPDGIVLCINVFDDIGYIKRTMGFIETSIGTKVIALVLCDNERIYSSNVFSKNYTNQEKLSKELCEKVFGVSVFTLLQLDIERLVDTIMEYYS